MATVQEVLSERGVLVGDGAWGTMLQAAGLPPGECPERWNASHPERVQAVAAAYVEAGSELILTNTFGGSPFALARHGLAERTVELNRAGAALSLQAASGALVAASVGPSGQMLAPLGTLGAEELEEGFRLQLEGVFAAGVRIVCVETMTALEEALCAVRAARAQAARMGIQVEVMATMTFDATPSGFRTVMGVDIPRAASALEEAGAGVVGSNCGNGIEQMVPIAAEFRRATRLPVLIQPNAGLPVLEGGRTVFRQTPAQMAPFVEPLLEAGVSILGGCCGTTPEHIAALRREVDRLRGRQGGA